ncbi:MAG: rubrerythrin [Blastocatellia bacterium]|nr:rubrerythrin [Blastocatellia bacterium]
MISEISRTPLSWAATLLLVLGMTVACDTSPADVPGGSIPVAASSVDTRITLDNLQTAFDSESNTAAKYLAFAVEADKSGYPKSARLFRAAAKAEEIHARNHAEAIRSMGAEPTSVVKKPEVGTTAANLWKAIQDESYERDNMYPPLIRQARDAGNAAAVRTFTFARSAETGHALLYSGALETLKDRRSATTQYYVCPGCGFTRTQLAGMSNCPACKTAMEEFVEVK